MAVAIIMLLLAIKWLASNQGRHAQQFGNAERALDTDASAQLRDRLLVEIAALASSDDATLWAHRSLKDKNRLSEQDALDIEQAFETRLATLSPKAGREVRSRPSHAYCHHRRKPHRARPGKAKIKGNTKRCTAGTAEFACSQVMSGLFSPQRYH
jgi:hypothetical protein